MLNVKSYCLTPEQYTAIGQYLADNDVRLLIADINGVLDDYYDIKFSFLNELLGVSEAHNLPHLWTYIEQAYITKKMSIESGTKGYFASQKKPLDSRQEAVLAAGMKRSKITDSAINFLGELKIKYVLYTSMNSADTNLTLKNNKYNVYTNNGLDIVKPSSVDLQNIIDKYKVRSDQVCMIGDGLIDDLMPASLIGLHTIIVTPYAQKLISL